MRITLAPEADQELSEAVAHYVEVASPLLGQAFLSEFSRATVLLTQSPRIGAPWRKQYRRVMLRRFPYSLIYVLGTDEIRILAIAHQRRRPGYWAQRK